MSKFIRWPVNKFNEKILECTTVDSEYVDTNECEVTEKLVYKNEEIKAMMMRIGEIEGNKNNKKRYFELVLEQNYSITVDEVNNSYRFAMIEQTAKTLENAEPEPTKASAVKSFLYEQLGYVPDSQIETAKEVQKFESELVYADDVGEATDYKEEPTNTDHKFYNIIHKIELFCDSPSDDTRFTITVYDQDDNVLYLFENILLTEIVSIELSNITQHTEYRLEMSESITSFDHTKVKVFTEYNLANENRALLKFLIDDYTTQLNFFYTMCNNLASKNVQQDLDIAKIEAEMSTINAALTSLKVSLALVKLAQTVESNKNYQKQIDDLDRRVFYLEEMTEKKQNAIEQRQLIRDEFKKEDQKIRDDFTVQLDAFSKKQSEFQRFMDSNIAEQERAFGRGRRDDEAVFIRQPKQMKHIVWDGVTSAFSTNGSNFVRLPFTIDAKRILSFQLMFGQTSSVGLITENTRSNYVPSWRDYLDWIKQVPSAYTTAYQGNKLLGTIKWISSTFLFQQQDFTKTKIEFLINPYHADDHRVWNSASFMNTPFRLCIVADM
jgi:hypothetical protein